MKMILSGNFFITFLKNNLNKNFYLFRKMSSVSMDEMKVRKESCLSDFGTDDLVPPETDAVP